MRSDEKPYYGVVAARPYGSVCVCHSHTPERQLCVQPLELETWMRGVRLKATIGVARTTLNVARKSGEIATER